MSKFQLPLKLVSTAAKEAGVTQAQARAAILAALTYVADAEKPVSFRGFGVFRNKHFAERDRYVPSREGVIRLPARTRLVFRSTNGK